MTLSQKIEILRSADPNTIIGMAVHNRLFKIDLYIPESKIQIDMVNRTIDNIKLSWDDSPATTQSCFAKHLNDLF